MSEGAERPSRMVRKRGLEPPLPCGNKLLRLTKIAADRGGPQNIEVRCPAPQPFVVSFGRRFPDFLVSSCRAWLTCSIVDIWKALAACPSTGRARVPGPDRGATHHGEGGRPPARCLAQLHRRVR